MKRTNSHGGKTSVSGTPGGLSREEWLAMSVGLTPAAGIRRGDFGDRICFAYRRGSGSTAETARMVAPLAFTSLTVTETRPERESDDMPPIVV